MGGDPPRGRVAKTRLESGAGSGQRQHLPAVDGDVRVTDAGRETAGCVMADYIGTRLRFSSVRQYPAYCARFETGRLRLGFPRLRYRFWRFHDLVRLVRRRRIVQSVSGGKIGGVVVET